jgi:hypothetical protein
VKYVKSCKGPRVNVSIGIMCFLLCLWKAA